MIFVAARRQQKLGGQWLMIISGAGSVFAGTTFVRLTGSPSAYAMCTISSRVFSILMRERRSRSIRSSSRGSGWRAGGGLTQPPKMSTSRMILRLRTI